MYNKEYDDSCIRSRNNVFLEFLFPVLNGNMCVLDLGCGTCKKVVAYSSYVKQIDAIDINSKMIDQAKRRTKNYNNVNVFSGDNLHLPFESNKYDICISCLSNYSILEVQRVLKNNGVFFLEMISPEDKFELKRIFGKDEIGERGYLCNTSSTELKDNVIRLISSFFQIEAFFEESWETTLTRKGFEKLLKLTPTIRNYSKKKDKRLYNNIVMDNQVSFTETRWYIISRKKG